MRVDYWHSLLERIDCSFLKSAFLLVLFVGFAWSRACDLLVFCKIKEMWILIGRNFDVV